MTAPTNASPARATRRSGPLVVIGGGLLAAAVWFLFLERPMRWSRWVNGAQTKANREALLAEPDPRIIDRIVEGMRDSDIPRPARVTLGHVLIQRNRLTDVEKAATDPSLDVRTVALETLATQSYFRTQYASNPEFRFGETMLAWLADASRQDRGSAIQILPQLHSYDAAPPPAVLAAVRALLGAKDAPATLRASAGGSLAGYRDCASADTMASICATEEDAEAKFKLMQALVQLLDSGGPDCATAVPKDRIVAIIARNLRHPGEGDLNRSVRMAALGVLRRHPEWATGETERMREILGSTAHEVERRAALEALVEARDASVVERFPAYFHDVNGGVRSSAAGVTYQEKAEPKSESKLGLSSVAIASLLAGYVGMESDTKAYEAQLRFAYSRIRQRAGVWVGLPEPFRTKGGSLTNDIATALHTFFSTGALEGTTRAQVAEALFRWVGSEAKLEAPAIDAAVKARAEFWAKARAGDVSGAKAAFDGIAAAVPDLWTFERGWLLAKQAR